MSPRIEEAQVTRGRFLAGAAALGAAPLALDRLAASAQASAAATSGVLRCSLGSDIRGFDVQRFYDLQSVTLADALFSRLVRADPRKASRILPDLAVAVPKPTDGGHTYTFELRDARFHDGSPVTADDVKFSLERLINPKTKSEGGSYYTGFIKDTAGIAAGKKTSSSGIVVVDEKTLRIELSQPHAAFLNLLALWFASIYPKATVTRVGNDAFNKKPVGCGPFKLDSYKPAQKIVMSQYSDYHARGQIALKGIELSLNVQPDTAILRIDSGDLDMMADELPAAAYSAIRADPKRKKGLVEALTDNVWYLTLNSVDDSPIFKTLAARKALDMAINKQRVLQQTQNRGVLARGFWSPRSQYYDAGFPTRSYNPTLAKSMLAQAGAAGQKVDVIVPAKGTFYPSDQWGPSLVQDLQQVGLKPNLVSLEFSAWLNKTMDRNAIVPNAWSMDNPHGSFVVDSAFTLATKAAADKSNTCCNFSHWGSKQVDQLDNVGNTTTSKAKEVAAYRQIMRTAIAQQALWITLFWPKRALYHGARVQNLSVPANTASVLLSRLVVSG